MICLIQILIRILTKIVHFSWFLLTPRPSGIDWQWNVPTGRKCSLVAEHLFHCANQFRIENDLPALKRNQKLELSSYNHAYRMAVTNEFAHALSDGLDLSERIARCKYQRAFCRENIAFTERSQTPLQLAETIHQLWVQSPGHRENLLADDVTELGCAVVFRRLDGRFYAVQNFATPTVTEAFLSSIQSARSVPQPKFQRRRNVENTEEIAQNSFSSSGHYRFLFKRPEKQK